MSKKKTQWGIQVARPNMKYWQDNKDVLSNKVPDLWNVGRFIHSTFSTRKEARIMAKRIGRANQYWVYRVAKCT